MIKTTIKTRGSDLALINRRINKGTLSNFCSTKTCYRDLIHGKTLVSEREHSTLMNAFNKWAANEVLSGESVQLGGLCSVGIYGVRSRNRFPINIKDTKQKGEAVYMTNEHSNFIRYRIEIDFAPSVKLAKKLKFVFAKKNKIYNLVVNDLINYPLTSKVKRYELPR